MLCRLQLIEHAFVVYLGQPRYIMSIIIQFYVSFVNSVVCRYGWYLPRQVLLS